MSGASSPRVSEPAVSLVDTSEGPQLGAGAAGAAASVKTVASKPRIATPEEFEMSRRLISAMSHLAKANSGRIWAKGELKRLAELHLKSQDEHPELAEAGAGGIKFVEPDPKRAPPRSATNTSKPSQPKKPEEPAKREPREPAPKREPKAKAKPEPSAESALMKELDALKAEMAKLRSAMAKQPEVDASSKAPTSKTVHTPAAKAAKGEIKEHPGLDGLVVTDHHPHCAKVRAQLRQWTGTALENDKVTHLVCLVNDEHPPAGFTGKTHILCPEVVPEDSVRHEKYKVDLTGRISRCSCDPKDGVCSHAGDFVAGAKRVGLYMCNTIYYYDPIVVMDWVEGLKAQRVYAIAHVNPTVGRVSAFPCSAGGYEYVAETAPRIEGRHYRLFTTTTVRGQPAPYLNPTTEWLWRGGTTTPRGNLMSASVATVHGDATNLTVFLIVRTDAVPAKTEALFSVLEADGDEPRFSVRGKGMPLFVRFEDRLYSVPHKVMNALFNREGAPRDADWDALLVRNVARATDVLGEDDDCRQIRRALLRYVRHDVTLPLDAEQGFKTGREGLYEVFTRWRRSRVAAVRVKAGRRLNELLDNSPSFLSGMAFTAGTAYLIYKLWARLPESVRRAVYWTVQRSPREANMLRAALERLSERTAFVTQTLRQVRELASYAGDVIHATGMDVRTGAPEVATVIQSLSPTRLNVAMDNWQAPAEPAGLALSERARWAVLDSPYAALLQTVGITAVRSSALRAFMGLVCLVRSTSSAFTITDLLLTIGGPTLEECLPLGGKACVALAETLFHWKAGAPLIPTIIDRCAIHLGLLNPYVASYETRVNLHLWWNVYCRIVNSHDLSDVIRFVGTTALTTATFSALGQILEDHLPRAANLLEQIKQAFARHTAAPTQSGHSLRFDVLATPLDVPTVTAEDMLLRKPQFPDHVPHQLTSVETERSPPIQVGPVVLPLPPFYVSNDAAMAREAFLTRHGGAMRELNEGLHDNVFYHVPLHTKLGCVEGQRVEVWNAKRTIPQRAKFMDAYHGASRTALEELDMVRRAEIKNEVSGYITADGPTPVRGRFYVPAPPLYTVLTGQLCAPLEGYVRARYKAHLSQSSITKHVCVPGRDPAEMVAALSTAKARGAPVGLVLGDDFSVQVGPPQARITLTGDSSGHDGNVNSLSLRKFWNIVAQVVTTPPDWVEEGFDFSVQDVCDWAAGDAEHQRIIMPHGAGFYQCRGKMASGNSCTLLFNTVLDASAVEWAIDHWLTRGGNVDDLVGWLKAAGAALGLKYEISVQPEGLFNFCQLYLYPVHPYVFRGMVLDQAFGLNPARLLSRRVYPRELRGRPHAVAEYVSGVARGLVPLANHVPIARAYIEWAIRWCPEAAAKVERYRIVNQRVYTAGPGAVEHTAALMGLTPGAVLDLEHLFAFAPTTEIYISGRVAEQLALIALNGEPDDDADAEA